MLKYLRIAVTALSLTACVLLLVLWIRSFWTADILICPLWSRRVALFYSDYGGLTSNLGTADQPISWRHDTSVSIRRDPSGIPPGGRWRPIQFGLTVDKFGFDLSLLTPHWFLAIIAAASGVAPWMKGRFSLRTLLIATTLVAVALAAIVYAAR